MNQFKTCRSRIGGSRVRAITKYISNVRHGAEFWQYLPKLILHNGDNLAEGRQNIF